MKACYDTIPNSPSWTLTRLQMPNGISQFERYFWLGFHLRAENREFWEIEYCRRLKQDGIDRQNSFIGAETRSCTYQKRSWVRRLAPVVDLTRALNVLNNIIGRWEWGDSKFTGPSLGQKYRFIVTECFLLIYFDFTHVHFVDTLASWLTAFAHGLSCENSFY